MIDCLSIVETDKFDKEIGSSDGLQPKQVDLSCVHALNELHLHEIRVVPREGQLTRGPFKRFKDQSPCCLFIMYSSILLFQESYISFSNIGGRLSALETIALSARVVIEKFSVECQWSSRCGSFEGPDGEIIGMFGFTCLVVGLPRPWDFYRASHFWGGYGLGEIREGDWLRRKEGRGRMSVRWTFGDGELLV
ncbi:hypothetical protein Tco_0935404 [Tanacetum coccineum]